MRIAPLPQTSTPSFLALLLATLIALGTGSAHAQTPAPSVTASDRAIAETLFDQALEAMKAKDYAAACPKFAESQRLDPSASTAFNLARCYQVTARLASAWASFRQAASIARGQNNEKVLQIATKAAEALAPQLPKLVITVPPSHRVDKQEVLRNGSMVNASLWGSAMPVDGGNHVIEARAPGHLAWSRTVTVPNEPAVVTVEVPVLEKAPEPEPPPAPPPAPVPTPAISAPLPPASVDEPGKTQRTAAYVVGGIGAAALTVGIGVGIYALAKNAASTDHCGIAAGNDDPNDCNAEGLPLRDEAQRAGSVSIGLLIAGGVAGGVGLTLYLTAPEPSDAGAAGEPARRRTPTDRASLRLRATPGGIALRGRW